MRTRLSKLPVSKLPFSFSPENCLNWDRKKGFFSKRGLFKNVHCLAILEIFEIIEIFKFPRVWKTKENAAIF